MKGLINMNKLAISVQFIRSFFWNLFRDKEGMYLLSQLSFTLILFFMWIGFILYSIRTAQGG